MEDTDSMAIVAIQGRLRETILAALSYRYKLDGRDAYDLAPSLHEPDSLPIAVRVYPTQPNLEKTARSNKKWESPQAMLILDTETRIDATQRLTFGS